MARGHIGNAGFAIPAYQPQQLPQVSGGGGLDHAFKMAGLGQQQGDTKASISSWSWPSCRSCWRREAASGVEGFGGREGAAIAG